MIEMVQEELIMLMEQTGKTRAQIAKETNLSTATVSQFLNGTYTGDNEKIAAALLKYIDEKQLEATALETRAMQVYPEFKSPEVFHDELIEMIKRFKGEG